MAQLNINNKLYKEPGITLGLYFAIGSATPIDSRMVVNYYSDLLEPDVWKINSNDPNIYAYKGMLVVVANDEITVQNEGLENEITINDHNGGKAFIYIGETANATEVAKDSNWVLASQNDATNAALSTLIGSDSGQSVRAIAENVVNTILEWQDSDANSVINTLKEVLDWFKNLPEGEAGALNLVNKVGSPAVLYTTTTANEYNAELTGAVSTSDTNPETSTNYTAEEAAAYNATLTGAVTEGDTKVAATGLYAIINNKNVDAQTSDTTYLDVSALLNTVTVNLTNSTKASLTRADSALLSITINDSINTSGYLHVLKINNNSEILYEEAVLNNNTLDTTNHGKAIVTAKVLSDYVDNSINWIES